MADKRSDIQDYVAARLAEGRRKAAGTERLSVPIADEDRFNLVFLCERLGLSQGGLASEFLRIAIEDAMRLVRPKRPTREQLSMDFAAGEYAEWTAHGLSVEDAFEQEMEGYLKSEQEWAAAYQAWVAGGRKGPRGGEQSEGEEDPQLEAIRERINAKGAR